MDWSSISSQGNWRWLIEGKSSLSERGLVNSAGNIVYIMNAHISNRASRFSWIPLLLVVILLSTACSSDGTTSSNSPSTTQPKATGTQLPAIVHLATGPITYIAMGASDAVGVGSNQPGAQGYVPLVATHLPKGSHMVNLGISGIRLHEALSQELPIALSTSPELITVWLVANDFVGGVSYEAYIHDLNTLLAQLHTSTHASLVMANLPDLTRLPAFSSLSFTQKEQMLVQIKRWNSGIAAAAARYGVRLADLFSHGSELTAHPEYISGDGFHPSPQGYVRLANIFWAVIEG
jgi:acyl-CoA thioesterase I